MRLNNESIKNREQWTSKGYALPEYDRDAVTERTKKEPRWIHFGAGNIFRAFQVKAMDRLLNEGLADTGIIAAEGRGSETAEKAYRPYDDLTLLIEFGEGGAIKKSVIGSVSEICAVGENGGVNGGFERMREIFRAPSLQLCSFTITEKGYRLTDSGGNMSPDVLSDLSAGPREPVSFMGKTAALLYERFLCGGAPVAMVSMDNCSDNGDVLRGAVSVFAEKWEEKGLADKGFSDYLKSGAVSFPFTMIDKITPRPDPSVEEMIKADGIEGAECIVTSKNTYTAAFVNAEETGYLVIEDVFPNGRPPFEKCGFYMTDRKTVQLTEKMKVCTCLNPLHTALAVFGCLLGYERICREAEDKLLRGLIERIGYDEGLPSAPPQSVIDPRAFLDEVVNVRLPNPHLPDTPQRIACDTSMKIPIRFGETVKWYVSRGEEKAAELKFIPLVLAGWLRYLTGINDRGEPFERSLDPFLSDSRAEYLHALVLGGEYRTDMIDSILSDSSIFGIDLCGTPVAPKVREYFGQMMAGTGAVENTLRNALGIGQ